MPGDDRDKVVVLVPIPDNTESRLGLLEEIKELLGRFGKVLTVQPWQSLKGKGHAFVTFEDSRSASDALTAQKIRFKDDILFINPPIATMWARYIRHSADKLSSTPELLRRMNDKSASDQFSPSMLSSQARYTADGTRSQLSVPLPGSNPNMRHRIAGSLDTNRSFVAKEPGSRIPSLSSNVRQYHQLERDVTPESKPPISSLTDVTPTNSHNALATDEQNPESTTTMSQHLLGDIGGLKYKLSMLETKSNRFRDQRDAAFTRAHRLTEDLARANQEIRRLDKKLSDLETGTSTLKQTVRSPEKERQLAEARGVDVQRQASTTHPSHNPYIHHGDHATGLVEAEARHTRELHRLEGLREERMTLLDDNQDLQKIIERFKDAEVDLKEELKSYQTDNEALRGRLAAANKSVGSGLMLNRELESKKNRIAQLTQSKEDAERALEQLKSTITIGPELIGAFSKLEAMGSHRGNLASRKRVREGSDLTGSSNPLTLGSGDPSVPIPKRQRYE